MARKAKEGLEYYPHDVDMYSDDKVKLLRARLGIKGYAVYTLLLAKIYRTNGFGAGFLEIRNQSATGVYIYLNKDVAGTTGYFLPAGATYTPQGVLVNKVNVAGSGGTASPVFISALPNIDPSKIL